MGILSRISKVLESNLNALVERAEDPSKMLDQAIEDMKRGRADARQAIIEAKTQMRLLERRRDKGLGDAQAFEKKAMQALKAGSEDLAKRCLEQKIACEHRAGAEMSAAAEQESQIRQLEVAERELDRRLAEMPARRAALLARQATAHAKGARVGAANRAKSSVSTALEAFERVEERVIRAEVEAEVLTDGDPALLDMGALDEDATEEALAALKAKMAAQLPAQANGRPRAEPDPVADSLAELKAKLDREG